MKLTQSLENREDQDAADLKAHALTKEIFLELLLVSLLGAKDSNILLLIWVCLRNGDVFAKQTPQCIEIVQSNQSSWDCWSCVPNSMLFCCTSQVSWIIFISIWESESWVHQILHNLQAVCVIVLHSNLHYCQAFFKSQQKACAWSVYPVFKNGNLSKKTLLFLKRAWHNLCSLLLMFATLLPISWTLRQKEQADYLTVMPRSTPYLMLLHIIRCKEAFCNGVLLYKRRSSLDRSAT